MWERAKILYGDQSADKELRLEIGHCRFWSDASYRSDKKKGSRLTSRSILLSSLCSSVVVQWGCAVLLLVLVVPVLNEVLQAYINRVKPQVDAAVQLMRNHDLSSPLKTRFVYWCCNCCTPGSGPHYQSYRMICCVKKLLLFTCVCFSRMWACVWYADAS